MQLIYQKSISELSRISVNYLSGLILFTESKYNVQAELALYTLQVNWEIAVDPQGSAALVGGAEAAVVYLRVAEAQSAIPDGAKEALVSLLDLAEQHFRAGAVIIALEKTHADSSALPLLPLAIQCAHCSQHAAVPFFSFLSFVQTVHTRRSSRVMSVDFRVERLLVMYAYSYICT